MAKIQSDLINQYQAASRQTALKQLYVELIEARKELTVEIGNPNPGKDDGSDNDDQDKDLNEDLEELKIDLKKQREELKNIAAGIQNISDNLKEPEKEEPTPEPDTNSGNNDGDGTIPNDQNDNSGEDNNSSDTGNDGQADGSTQDQDQQKGKDGQEQNGDASDGASDSGQTETGTSTEQTASSDSALQFIKLANEGGTGDSGDTGSGGDTTEPGDQDQPGNDDISDIARAKEQLSEASERIEQIEEELKINEKTHNEELIEKIEEMQKQINGLKKQIDELKNEVIKKRKQVYQEIFNNIDRLEERAQLHFDTPIEKEDVTLLLKYYNLLSIYESTLSGTVNTSIKEDVLRSQQGNVQSVLALTPAESASWEALKNNTMQTDEDINSFIDGMTKFADDYSGFIRDSQAGVLDELTKISESAAKALEQLVTGATQESATFSNDGLSGTMALSVQDTALPEVLQMSDMMGSLSDRQSGIIDYTTNMQQSVNDVQAKADTLNNNWGKNVASTKLVRNDVYGILGNTLVDGQNNGYVYDYLANPLKISGEVPEEKFRRYLRLSSLSLC